MSAHRHNRTSTAAHNNEKNLAILKQLLRETPNRTCADCKTSQHPRWASWSLGCFICIRCSGIHRGMGTHISKVKSVDLDTWKDDEVENMVKWGNQKSNQFWEAKLPEGYVPDQSKIENFIRTKYDMKKWAASTNIPDPMTLAKSAPKTTAGSSSGNSRTTATLARPVPTHANLLDDDDEFGEFSANSSGSGTPKAVTPKPTPRGVTPKPTPQLHSQLVSQINTLPPVPPKTHRVHHTVSTPAVNNQSIANPPGGNNGGRADLKKSILSLYSSPSSSNSSFFNQPASSAPAQRSNYNIPSSTSTITNSLHSLNLNTNSAAHSVSPQPRTSTAGAGAQWANEWSGLSSSTARPLNSNPTPMDDDLFKNVWG